MINGGGEYGGEKDENGDESTLRLDLWTRQADANNLSAASIIGAFNGTFDLNDGTMQNGERGEGSDCSSDSLVVDVLKGRKLPAEYSLSPL